MLMCQPPRDEETQLPVSIGTGIWAQGQPRIITPSASGDPKTLLNCDRIANPLADIPRGVLMRDVDDFAQVNGLQGILPQLRKGALLAQEPGSYEQLGLGVDERAAVRTEILHKWKHPLALYLTVAICSIGAAVQ